MLLYFASFWVSEPIASFVFAQVMPGARRLLYGLGAVPGRDQPDRFL